jgi:extracellular factor (EF) 3-hydroxypalmitic acid methyl ester biosynthesis protein
MGESRQFATDAVSDLNQCLSAVQANLESGNAAAANDLVPRLAALRRSLPQEIWRQQCKDNEHHPALGILRHDPYIARAYQKPRGFAGDAETLDYVYAGASRAEQLSDFAKRLLYSSTSQPIAEAVRDRMKSVVQEIQRVALSREAASIASVACGHLREYALVPPEVRRALREWIAIDQDKLALAVVEDQCSESQVIAEHISLSRVIAGTAIGNGKHSLIYSLGLFDYLPDNVAVAALRAMSAQLEIGGRLLVANLAPGQDEIAYMEAVADWFMTYRTAPDLEQLATSAGLVNGNVSSWSIAGARVAFLAFDRMN